jgi:hypothetical protein
MRKLAMIVLLAVVPALLGAEAPARKPMEGAWKVVEIVVTGADAATIASPQPGLFLFGPKHYSMTWIRSAEPRALYAAEVPTNEEKIKAFDSLVASAGTYEVSGSTIAVRPMVARNPNFMAGGSSRYEFRVDGNTLWLTERSTDTRYRIGGQVVPPARAPSETRHKLVRLE